MKFHELLQHYRSDILDIATERLMDANLPHYKSLGEEQCRAYLAHLLETTRQSAETHNLMLLNQYVEEISENRFYTGYPLYEVQHAIEDLETAVWVVLRAQLNSEDFNKIAGQIGMYFGAGKNLLAEAYVIRATQRKKPTINLQALFTGTDGV